MTDNISTSTNTAHIAGSANAPAGKTSGGAGADDSVAILFAEILAQNSKLAQRGQNAGIATRAKNTSADAASLKLAALKKLTGTAAATETADIASAASAVKSGNGTSLPDNIAALLAKANAKPADPNDGVQTDKADAHSEPASTDKSEQAKAAAKTQPKGKEKSAPDVQTALAALAVAGAASPASAPAKTADAAVIAIESKAAQPTAAQVKNGTPQNAGAANGAAANSPDANEVAPQSGKQADNKADNKAGGKADSQQAANPADVKTNAKANATADAKAATDTLAKLNLHVGDKGKSDAQTLARHAPDAQATKAQATPVQFDAASAKLANANGPAGQNTNGQNANGQNANGQNANGQSANGQSANNHNHGNNHNTAPDQSAQRTTQPAQIQPAHSQTQAQPSTAAHTSGPATPVDTSSASAQAAANAPQTTAKSGSAIAANLQVAPQTAANAQMQAQANLAALAVNIAARSNAGIRHFDIRLDPPEMGRVDVRLSVDDSGKAQAHLAADKPQALAMLQRDSSQLERALREAGLQLANNGLNFSLKGQDRQDQQAHQFSRRGGRNLSISAIAATDVANANPLSSSLSASNARLDIRV